VLEYTGETCYDNPYFMFLEVAKQYEDGAKKYAERNWEKVNRYMFTLIVGVRQLPKVSKRV